MAFGMNDMLADMVKKMIPQEVLDALTPEKISEYKEQINAFAVGINERFQALENLTVNNQRRLDEIITLVEEMKNAGDSNISGSPEQPKPGGSRKRGANRSGSGDSGNAD